MAEECRNTKAKTYAELNRVAEKRRLWNAMIERH